MEFTKVKIKITYLKSNLQCTDETYETENQFYIFEFQFYSHANGFYGDWYFPPRKFPPRTFPPPGIFPPGSFPA